MAPSRVGFLSKALPLALPRAPRTGLPSKHSCRGMSLRASFSGPRTPHRTFQRHRSHEHKRVETIRIGRGEQRQEWDYGSGDGFAEKVRSMFPLPWIFVSGYAIFDLVLDSYLVKEEDFSQLIRRCKHEVEATPSGQVNGLDNLKDLLYWTIHSVETIGVTALPKLLEAGVLDVAKNGATSPNAQVLALCHGLLNLLSCNKPVAGMMAEDSRIRSLVIHEAQQQLHVSSPKAPVQDRGGGPGHSMVKEMQGLVGYGRGREGNGGPGSKDRYANSVGRTVGGKEANGNGKNPEAFAEEEKHEGEGDNGDSTSSWERSPSGSGTEEHPESGTAWKVHPVRAALGLHTLYNTLKASPDFGGGAGRSCDGTVSREGRNGRDGVGTWVGRWQRGPVFWPLSLLYGHTSQRDNAKDKRLPEVDGISSAESSLGRGMEDVRVLDCALTGRICELLQRINPDVFTAEWWGTSGPVNLTEFVMGLDTSPGNTDWAKITAEKQSVADVQGVYAAIRDLEFSAISVLHEMSSRRDTASLLMNRDCVGTLLVLALAGRTLKTMLMAKEAVSNVGNAYRRELELGENVQSISVWVDMTGEIETEDDVNTGVTPPLGPGLADRSFMDEVQRLHPPAVPPYDLSFESQMTLSLSSFAFIVGAVWGTLREWAAIRVNANSGPVVRFMFGGGRSGGSGSQWIPSGVMSGGGLARSLLLACVRAGTGAALLTAIYGQVGYRFMLKDYALDRPGESTLVKAGARAGVDLGVLYGVLRLCPYSFLPALVVDTMVGSYDGLSMLESAM